MAEIFKMYCSFYKEIAPLMEKPCLKPCPMNAEYKCHRQDLCSGAKEYLLKGIIGSETKEEYGSIYEAF